MAHTDTKNDLAFELVARWEGENERGNCVSLDEVCAAHPGILARARTVARGIAEVSPLLSPGGGGGEPPAGAPPAGGSPAGEPPAGEPPGDEAGYPDDWEEIGSGASSIVYRGQDPTFGTAVAFKVLHTQGHLLTSEDILRLMRRFELEARILARLKHEGIVRIFKTFGLGGRPVLEMEYLPGGSLVTHAEEVRARGAAGIARFVERVARAVGFAHEHKIVHRDLKPSNILLDGAGRPCVTDFGVAKLIHTGEYSGPVAEPGGETDHGLTDLTAHGRQPGTYAYMAPEQFDPSFGEIKPATDVWALGVVLHELLYGVRPFLGGTRKEMRELVCRRPAPVGRRGGLGLWGRLNRIVLRCLELDQVRRFENARQLADALRDAVSPRRWWLAAAVAALTAGVALGGFGGPPRPPADPVSVPQPTPEWSAHPAVRDARDRLARGEPVVLIDRDKPPAAFHWARGPETGKVLRSDDGQFGVYSICFGGALLELLPDLPPGRYRIEAELKHEMANGPSWVGVFAAASHWTIARGRQHFFVTAKYADLGFFSAEGPPPGWMRGRRTHLMAMYLGDSDRSPILSTQHCAPHPGRELVGAPPPGWRTVSLVVEDGRVVAEQQAGQPVGVLDANTLEAVGRRALGEHPDLVDRLNIRMHGGVGLYICNASVLVNRFQVTPILPPK